MKLKNVVFATLAIFVGSISAETHEETSALSYDSVEVFINDYSKENKYSKEQLIEIFARTKIKKKIVSDSKNQPEVKLNWETYKSRVVTDAKVEQGKLFIKENIQMLEKAENEFGVPKEVITAIIGIESFYGKYKGNYNAIDALSTLSFEGSKRRNKFFKKELTAFLNNTFENEQDPLKIKSSWAGAFGYPQFISSSIRAYGVDFNNDGKIDLIDSKEDAIGSVANYLKKHGWKKDNYIAEEVFNVNLKKLEIGKFSLNYNVSDLKNQGVSFNRNMRLSKKLKLFKLDGKNTTEYWVGYENFKAITHYNRSNLYAMAVFSLANKIKGNEVL